MKKTIDNLTANGWSICFAYHPEARPRTPQGWLCTLSEPDAPDDGDVLVDVPEVQQGHYKSMGHETMEDALFAALHLANAATLFRD